MREIEKKSFKDEKHEFFDRDIDFGGNDDTTPTDNDGEGDKIYLTLIQEFSSPFEEYDFDVSTSHFFGPFSDREEAEAIMSSFSKLLFSVIRSTYESSREGEKLPEIKSNESFPKMGFSDYSKVWISNSDATGILEVNEDGQAIGMASMIIDINIVLSDDKLQPADIAKKAIRYVSPKIIVGLAE